MLRILFVAFFVCTFLLTPLALEPRPFSVISPIGFASLALIFTVVALDIVALLILNRNPRTAGLLAAVGPFLYIGPLIGDQVGLFASVRPPLRITTFEVIAFLTQLAILFFAVRLRGAGAKT
jgi:hypothetical protein